MKITDKEFRMVMTEAYRQFLEAVSHWERVEWVNRDQTGAKDRQIVCWAEEEMKKADAVISAVLGEMTNLHPHRKTRRLILSLLKAARKGKKG